MYISTYIYIYASETVVPENAETLYEEYGIRTRIRNLSRARAVVNLFYSIVNLSAPRSSSGAERSPRNPLANLVRATDCAKSRETGRKIRDETRAGGV